MTNQYKSQCKQDRYVNENFFHNQKDLFFVDIGAYDGINLSNSHFFEKVLDWKGICIEPLPEAFAKLQKERSCICINACVSDSNAENQTFYNMKGVPMLSGLQSSYVDVHEQRAKNEGAVKEVLQVKNVQLKNVLKQHGVKRVDFLSVDVEGGELGVLKSIDFNQVYFHVLTIENNYKTSHVKNYLEGFGFRHVTTLDADEIFINTLPDWTIYWNRVNTETIKDSLEHISKHAYAHNFNFCCERFIPSVEASTYGFVLGNRPLIAFVYLVNNSLSSVSSTSSTSLTSSNDTTLANNVKHYASVINQQPLMQQATIINAPIGELNLLDKDGIVIHMTMNDQDRNTQINEFIQKCNNQKRPKLVCIKCMDAFSQTDNESFNWLQVDTNMITLGYKIYKLYNNATVYVIP